MNTEIRKLYNELSKVLNEAQVPVEAKRIVLEDLARQCEIQANNAIMQEQKTITEEGDLENGTGLE